MNAQRFGFPAVAASLGATFIGLTLVSSALAADPAGATKTEGAALLGGALPGGAVISARSVGIAPAAGGQVIGTPIAADGSFRAVGLAPGAYRLAVTSTSLAKQTQGATFGEKVNAGLHAAGSAIAQGAAKTKHDTAKNSVGNVRAREASTPGGTDADAASDAGRLPDANSMPNRISMNVTVAKQTQQVIVDDTVVTIEVGADGILAGRVAGP
jgi:hypothetical protein